MRACRQENSSKTRDYTIERDRPKARLPTRPDVATTQAELPRTAAACLQRLDLSLGTWDSGQRVKRSRRTCLTVHPSAQKSTQLPGNFKFLDRVTPHCEGPSVAAPVVVCTCVAKRSVCGLHGAVSEDEPSGWKHGTCCHITWLLPPVSQCSFHVMQHTKCWACGRGPTPPCTCHCVSATDVRVSAECPQKLREGGGSTLEVFYVG